VVIDAGDQSETSVRARVRVKAGVTKLDVGSHPSPDAGRDEVVYTLERREE